MILDLQNGDAWEVRVPHAVDPASEPGTPISREVDSSTTLPASNLPITIVRDGTRYDPREGDPGRLYVKLQSRYGPVGYGLGQTVWRRADLSLGRDWWSGEMVLAVLLTPVTVIVDCITAPIEVGWMFLTAGGHGRNPIPWCEH